LPLFISENDKFENDISDLESLLSNKMNNNFHADILTIGKKIIKCTIKECITFLCNSGGTPKKRSIDKVTEYVDAFVTFEELLFGLNPDYRDHTLHSLWVFLFGHEMIKKLGGYSQIKLAGQLNITYSITVNSDVKQITTYTDLVTADEKHLEAMWGMVALLHDFGYPVEKISNQPNEIFSRLLEPFAIDFLSIFKADISSRTSLLYPNICNIIGFVYRPKSISIEELIKKANNQNKVYRPPDTSKAEAHEMEFRINCVENIHSAWSAIFAFKNISYLHESDHEGGGNRDYKKLLTQRDILYSIIHHTSEEPKDAVLNRFQFILLLIDDLEEIARFGKGGKERGIEPERCTIEWLICKNKMEIELNYNENEELAKRKYKELNNKYKMQIDKKYSNIYVNLNYEIEISFIANREKIKNLKMHLITDN
jgi:hypothetical protein